MHPGRARTTSRVGAVGIRQSALKTPSGARLRTRAEAAVGATPSLRSDAQFSQVLVGCVRATVLVGLVPVNLGTAEVGFAVLPGEDEGAVPVRRLTLSLAPDAAHLVL